MINEALAVRSKGALMNQPDLRKIADHPKVEKVQCQPCFPTESEVPTLCPNSRRQREPLIKRPRASSRTAQQAQLGLLPSEVGSIL